MLPCLPSLMPSNVAVPAGKTPTGQTATDKANNAKIDKSAKDFESLLLTNWLQGAQESFAGVPGGDDDADKDPGSDQLKGFAMQSLGTALTASGGIGLAHSISSLLHKSDTPALTKAAPQTP